jgi:hypothetical protein
VGTRTFVVRVSESETRVIVEDVRSRERVVATALAGVPAAIERLLSGAPEGAPARPPRRPAEPPA